MRQRGVWGVWALWVSLVGACGDGEVAGAEPIAFPEDVTVSYREMRDCRQSHEHELRFIRVFASPSAEDAYAALDAEVPYAVGDHLVKVEYDDEACAVPIEYTVMQKLPEGTSERGHDWLWQRQSLEREVLEDGAPSRCVTCHLHHCAPPDGYDLTCAEEL